jgi:hypothetical protein
VAALVLGYVNKYAGWFPKYQVAFVPLLACLAAPLVAHAWCARPRFTVAVGGLATLASAALSYRLVGDQWALSRSWTIDPSAGGWLLFIALAAALVGLVMRVPAATAVAALIAMGLGWELALDVRQLRAPYQTDYWYGTAGIAETVGWINAHLQPNDTYVASKEAAIASRAQRYVDQDNIVYYLSVGRPFDTTWNGEPLRALVTWQREPYVADLLSAGLDRKWRETARYGDYVVYELTDGS